ncbi:hypothetical protein TRFO_26823 [Tritrichomonas foetus]|uniref:Phospholipid-transporting ATPase n=1 Tax=Tritrichomonas foetus TaxID=1144522 RepID=A0A1J4K7S3_9EUKA|nr:hypothetical protein TRFO_26823 [Tritrichomonas foetus]|eukprot:OHT05469.1 hypothetical protein TRFO_26823 [Tritrichomonas foetus]
MKKSLFSYRCHHIRMPKKELFDPLHHCFIGESSRNPSFPRNTQKTSVFAYLKLLASVIWVEVNTFYSLYFIILGLLEFIPEVSTANAWMTLLPLLFVFILEYLVQAFDLFSVQKSIRSDDKRKYVVTRDHKTKPVASKNIKPGDLIEISDQSTVPCDCILLSTDQMSVFINTSKIDGETDVKDRVPLKFPNNFTNGFIKTLNGSVTATGAQSSSRQVEGEVIFSPNSGFDFDISDRTDTDSQSDPDYKISNNDEKKVGFHQNVDGSITSIFDNNSFIERGSLIETSGTHLLLALYTGKHCRSDAAISPTATRKTMIDNYLEKISMFIFVFQLIISIILGTLGYLSLQNDDHSYIPSVLLHEDLKMWMLLIVIVRNFLMLSFMVPITLKLLLPIFRFIYGMFISNDLNFVDTDTGNVAEALSTNMTENLGALDVIISDKTGTLTKNKLTLISLIAGNEKYGDSRKAPTILEDQVLHDNFKSVTEEDFILTFQALAVCHTIKISSDQQFHGSSADELAILTALQKLGWKFYEDRDLRRYESPLGNYDLRVLKVNTFNRKRMRMSVVVAIGNDIFCFMKGAPERILRQCSSRTGELASNYEDFQLRGLRTMSISYKRLDKYDEYMEIEEMESGHRLLGTMGIEDALQNDVQLTLDLLSDAGLKIWVATGDAKTNTLVVSAMLHLLRANEQVVHIDTQHLLDEASLETGTFENPLFSTKAMMVAENSFSTVINAEDDKVLRIALEKKKFLNALYRSRCVIYYRCKPSTKADIAIALQNNGKRVLGIGDGYNDSLLLRASDVGVGIKAPDGSKAFATCDFAIPAFRSLGRLILIHGHQALHRSVLAVHFSFYKAVLFAMCQTIYQVWTSYSGQSLFDEFALFCFNNVWTLLPILSLLFEKDVGENFLYRLSYLYKKLRNPLTLRPSNITWFIVAVYQGAIIMLISWALTGEGYFNSSGKDFGASYLSLVLYFSMVLICAFYMLYQTNTFTYYSMVLIFGNILMLVASSALFQSGQVFGQGDAWIGFYGECFNNINTLIIIVTIVLAAVSPSWIGLSVWSEYQNSDSLRVIETETNAAKNDQPLFFDPPKNN